MTKQNMYEIFIFILFIFLSSSPTCICKSTTVTGEPEDEHEFDYLEGSHGGPGNWGNLKAEWSTCRNGKIQSPIDIYSKYVETNPHLERLKRVYKPGPATLKNRGHDIMSGNRMLDIYTDEIDYHLKQVHWHSPSEHMLNGTRYQAEVHMLHVSKHQEVAVVGLLYKLGRPDRFLEKIMPHIHNLETSTTDYAGIINPKHIQIGSRKYYRYKGSLTVPPCTEGIIWTIFSKVRTISNEQLKALRIAVHDGFEENARPVQPFNNRSVHLYTPTVI